MENRKFWVVHLSGLKKFTWNLSFSFSCADWSQCFHISKCSCRSRCQATQLYYLRWCWNQGNELDVWKNVWLFWMYKHNMLFLLTGKFCSYKFYCWLEIINWKMVTCAGKFINEIFISYWKNPLNRFSIYWTYTATTVQLNGFRLMGTIMLSLE